MQETKSKKKPIVLDAQGEGFKALKGQTLPGGFLVSAQLDGGAYGKIYEC